MCGQSTVDEMMMMSKWNLLLFYGCLLGLTGGTTFKSAWELPTTEQLENSLQSCENKTAGEDQAIMLRCLMEQLGLWTDDQGYNANRIAKIFAAHRQMEELMVVIEYCNDRERREQQPAQWALEAYKCATSGRFGRWVKDYVNQKQKKFKNKKQTFYY